ncbi:MAG: 30S ribosomal protein S14 [Planctomycetota bacterium]|jgi:small subunit ribosomal protein S14|nr:30S ribosomal protein S14 [Planctomycetota bacterium]
MAKKSKVARQQQRTVLVDKFAAKRAELRKLSKDPKLSLDERMEARAALGELPRNSAAVRLKNRCMITGRPHGYIRRLGVSRNMVRELAHDGFLPGCRKASW